MPPPAPPARVGDVAEGVQQATALGWLQAAQRRAEGKWRETVAGDRPGLHVPVEQPS